MNSSIKENDKNQRGCGVTTGDKIINDEGHLGKITRVIYEHGIDDPIQIHVYYEEIDKKRLHM